MTHILLIEDEAALVDVLTDRLVAEGYEVSSCKNGVEGEHMARSLAFGLVILDLMLPERSGLDVCRSLRGDGIQTPILMLTARGEVADKVVGLRLGADDYLTKPFEMSELLARVEALLRRSPGGPGGTLRFGDAEIDIARGEVRRNNQALDLSVREFDLLVYLARNPGQVLSRHRLLSEVWNYDTPPPTRTVDVHVSWLRQKLEPDPRRPRYIRTVHGVGYKFVP